MNEVVEITIRGKSKLTICAPSRGLAVDFAEQNGWIAENDEIEDTNIITDSFKIPDDVKPNDSQAYVEARDITEFAKFGVSCRIEFMYNELEKNGKPGTVWVMVTGDRRMLYNDDEKGIVEWS